MDLEKKQALYDLTEEAGWPIFLEYIEEMAKLLETEVVRYDLNSKGLDGLLKAKYEAQGARRLKHLIETHMKQLRMAALKAEE